MDREVKSRERREILSFYARSLHQSEKQTYSLVAAFICTWMWTVNVISPRRSSSDAALCWCEKRDDQEKNLSVFSRQTRSSLANALVWIINSVCQTATGSLVLFPQAVPHIPLATTLFPKRTGCCSISFCISLFLFRPFLFPFTFKFLLYPEKVREHMLDCRTRRFTK